MKISILRKQTPRYSQGGEGTKNCGFLQSRGTKKLLRRNLHDTIKIPFPVVGNIINAYPTHLGTKYDPCFHQQHTASRAVIFNLLSGNCGFGRLTSSPERFLTRGYLNAIKVEQLEDITDCAIYNITIS